MLAALKPGSLAEGNTVELVELVVASGVVGIGLTYGQQVLQGRRDRYAEVVANLISKVEYPYRIRRRIDDQPATLGGLASRGHDLQERIARDQAWVAADSKRVSSALCAARSKVDPWFTTSAQAAWMVPPVGAPIDMNAELKGPGCEKELRDLEAAIQKRCRWYRAIA